MSVANKTRCSSVTGAATAELAANAGRLLERSLLGELRAVAARALSGLDMFSGDFAELVAGDAAFAPGSSPPDVGLAMFNSVFCSHVQQ